jgi:hypothetical protein
MKRSPLTAAATLTLLMTSALVAPQNYAQDTTHEMPEVKVTGEVPVRQHPQDGNYSHRPLGCVEIVTPSGTGNELGGYFQARNAPSGIAVMPSLNDPRSANETYRRGVGPGGIDEYQASTPGESIPNKCR